ncbi:hypothetical protein ANCCAN_19256 [Ancylostoma caninum]|uniref:Chromo domain-containing protein n=1 Tax=Ancylostoma caninum TaxID=29170 RepID=A0A368FRQ5_ANCCA|nr:hypothetical protein ANCCAN_19256 [Ancylostoma caninum]
MQYGVGDLVRCIWGAKPVEYEAKILDVDNESQEYYVHYQGWNKRYDEWISEESIIGLSKKHAETPPTTETPKVRHSKREKKVKKPIDWSPAHNPPARSEEKPLRRKVPHASTKSKHSPVSKIAKHSASSVSPVLDDSSDDGLSSDEETVDLSIPRSYIDVLAKEKKKAERKQEKGRTPQFLSSAKSCKVPQTKAVSSGAQAITRLIPINKHLPASASSSTVSSTCMECHNFASIGADYNYSSLRFHYNKARPLGSERKDPSASEVSSSTKRVLPVRKPLNFEFAPPYQRLAFNFSRPTSSILSRTRPIEMPPNLGSPYKYNDEYHAGLISSSMNYKSSLAAGSSRPHHSEESDSRTFSSSSSEPDDISTTIVPIITSEAVSTVTIVT